MVLFDARSGAEERVVWFTAPGSSTSVVSDVAFLGAAAWFSFTRSRRPLRQLRARWPDQL